MKHKLSTSLGLIVLLTIAFAASLAKAQTVAPGPYYANPSWDQTLSCTTLATCPRFIVLSNMANAAVLDRETGLVWEKSPSTSTFPWSSSTIGATDAAAFHCNQLTVGNRLGWKLPTIQELASLVDADPAHYTGFGPLLPPGHPFQNVQGLAVYWSATTSANLTDSAWGVFFLSGQMLNNVPKTFDGSVWCVRGGQGVDAQ